MTDDALPAKGAYSIFISYSRKDIGLAKLLIKQIESQCGNVRIFIDERGIEGGDPIKERIRENIECCDELLVILSDDSVKSTWVTIEISAAWALRKRIVAIVFKVTPQDALPIIADLEAIQLEHLDGYLAQLSGRVRER